jgi:hypothetical protein
LVLTRVAFSAFVLTRSCSASTPHREAIGARRFGSVGPVAVSRPMWLRHVKAKAKPGSPPGQGGRRAGEFRPYRGIRCRPCCRDVQTTVQQAETKVVPAVRSEEKVWYVRPGKVCVLCGCGRSVKGLSDPDLP